MRVLASFQTIVTENVRPRVLFARTVSRGLGPEGRVWFQPPLGAPAPASAYRVKLVPWLALTGPMLTTGGVSRDREMRSMARMSFAFKFATYYMNTIYHSGTNFDKSSALKSETVDWKPE